HHPDRACLVEGDVVRIYRDVHARVGALAGALDTLGGAPGERCAVLAPNCALTFECMLAIYRAGRVFVPLNAKNHIRENAHVAQQSEAQTLFFHSSLAEQVEALRAACPALARFVCMDTPHADGLCVDELVARDLPPPPMPAEDNTRLVSIYSTG